MSHATITLPYDEYLSAIKMREEALARIPVLERELRETRLNAGDNTTTRQLTTLARDMIPIVRFAMSNLSPEVIKGWPAKALRDTAAGIRLLPDRETDDLSFAHELDALADDADAWDRRRRSGEIKTNQPNDLPSLEDLRAGSRL